MPENRTSERAKTRRFEEVMLPHLDAAYNLARWLLHTRDGAEDVVQESFLRAFRFFDGYRGGDSKAWVLAIVRNSCYSWLRQNRARDLSEPLDEDRYVDESGNGDPERFMQQTSVQDRVREALAKLPEEFREVVVLRDLEGLSYKEIANVINIPVGTVMSRLARGRKQLERCLGKQTELWDQNEL